MSDDKSKKDWKKVRNENESPNEQEMEELMENLEAGSGALDHASYTELEDKLTETEQKAHENWEKSVRAMAELENVRRRAERDVENAHRYGLEKFVDSLLPVVDSLEQAMQLAEKDENSSMYEGLELTMKLFVDVLKKHGVEQLNPVGEPFDPQLHEAMSMQVSEDVAPNTVLVVFQRGYKLNDRIVRPARVIVSKGS
jgi:molecular chaperone GrpE